MTDNKVVNLLDDKNKWLSVFVLTFALAFYWLPEQVPLFYSQALPEEKLASKYYLLIIPLFIYLFFIASELFLKRLALKNNNMLNLIKLFRIGLAIFSYLLYFKIIILVL